MFESIRNGALRGYVEMGSVVGGNLARNLLRGVFKLLVAGFLTPQAFGVMRSVYSLYRIAATMADLGIDYAAMTLIGSALGRDDRDTQLRLERVSLGLKLGVSAVFLVAGNLAAPFVALYVLGDASLAAYVRLAFSAVGGQLLWRHVVNHLTAHQSFGRLAVFLTTVPMLMLVAAGALILAGSFDLTASLLIYLVTPVVAVAIWGVLLRAHLPWRPLWDGRLAGDILRFGRWVYVSNIASTNRNHLNALLLKNPRFAGSIAAGELNAGLYAFGADLAGEITVFSQSLLSVMLPRASRKSGPDALRRYVRRSYVKMAYLVIPLLLLVFVARPFVLLLGQIRPSFLEYLPSLGVFTILYIGNLLSLMSIPMQTALYALRRPEVETGIEVVGLVVLVVVSVMLIPRFGVEGAAAAVLIQRVLSFVALIGYGGACLRNAGETAT